MQKKELTKSQIAKLTARKAEVQEDIHARAAELFNTLIAEGNLVQEAEAALAEAEAFDNLLLIWLDFLAVKDAANVWHKEMQQRCEYFVLDKKLQEHKAAMRDKRIKAGFELPALSSEQPAVARIAEVQSRIYAVRDQTEKFYESQVEVTYNAAIEAGAKAAWDSVAESWDQQRAKEAQERNNK